MSKNVGAPSPKPTDLAGPIPGEEEIKATEDMFADFRAPEMAAPAADPTPTPEDPFADFRSEPMPEGAAPAPGFPREDSDDFLGFIDLNIARQFKDHSIRAAAKIAANPDDVELTLQSKLGPENVFREDDVFYIRPHGEEKFRRLDPPTIQIINDLYSDFLKEYIQAGAAAAGAQQGAMVGAPGGPITSAGMAAGGAVLGVAGATSAVRSAEQALGVVRKDPDTALQAVAKDLSEGMMWVSGDKAGKMLPGAFKAIKTKLFGVGTTKIEAESAKATAKQASAMMDDVAQTAAKLKENGIDVKSGKMVLTPGQVLDDIKPEAKEFEKVLTTQEAVREFFKVQAQKFKTGFDTLLNSIVNTTGKSSDDLFLKFKGATKVEREIVGKTIGMFREEAAKAGGKTRFPMLRFQDAGLRMYMDLGGRVMPDGRIQPPKVTDLMARFRGMDKTDATALRDQATVLMRKLTRKTKPGDFTIKEMEGMYNLLTKQIDSSMGSERGRVFAKNFIGVKNALRDDWVEAMGKVLPEERLAEYTTQVERFTNIANAQKTLSNLLKQPDMNTAALANRIFSTSNSRKNVQAFKALVDAEDPTLFNDLVGQKIDLIINSAVNKKGVLDFATLSKTLDKLDANGVLKEMFSPKDRALLKNFMKLASKVPPLKFQAGALPGSQKKGLLQWGRSAAVQAMNTSTLAKISEAEKAMTRMMGNMDIDAAALKWLDGEGLELVVGKFPKAQQSKVRQIFGRVVKNALAIATEKTAAMEAADMAPDYDAAFEESKKINRRVK